MIAEISLEMNSVAAAEDLNSIISPDNIPLPTGLTINCYTENRILRIEIHSERSIESLGATYEDIMNAIDLALRTGDTIGSTGDK